MCKDAMQAVNCADGSFTVIVYTGHNSRRQRKIPINRDICVSFVSKSPLAAKRPFYFFTYCTFSNYKRKISKYSEKLSFEKHSNK
jgi:hypothetical protein